jgi:phosphohistidine phosphatase
MKHLILMRHATSDSASSGMSDFDRPLSSHGSQELLDIARQLMPLPTQPDLIISSSACRARQTTDGVMQQTAWDDDILNFDASMYLASLNYLIDVCDTHAEQCDCLMLVGHNPGLEDFLKYLCKQNPPRSAYGELLTPANVAVLELSDCGVRHGGQATLLELFRP